MSSLPRLVVAALLVAAAGVVGPASAQAEDTVWICKPGQSDDLCAGTISGQIQPPPGGTAQPLGYTRPADPPIDCFYLYPTQSSQPPPNANLDKDPPIRRAVVLQARMFSTVCDVYAPAYRQVPNGGDQTAINPSVETAYQSAKGAFLDFLKNHNKRRGFIMIGHSQGSAHTARLISELVDTNRKLRNRFVGALAPGANIAVPIGGTVGGLFTKVPACTGVGQFGCVVAFSTYNDVPPPTASFSRVDTGYWIYPQPRFSSSSFEVMCTNPAVLDGGDGTLLPLLNFDYLVSAPSSETVSPWTSQTDYYRGECKRSGGSHWLNLSKVGLPGDGRADLAAAVASGSNYHVPEFNLTEGNMLRVATNQRDGYLKRVAKLKGKVKSLRSRLAKAKKRGASKKRIVRLKRKIARVKRSLP